jgi:predicted DNA-binding protein
MSKPVEKKTEPVGLRLRPSLKKALDELSAADRRPLATYIEFVLEDHVAAKKAEGGKPAGKRK